MVYTTTCMNLAEVDLSQGAAQWYDLMDKGSSRKPGITSLTAVSLPCLLLHHHLNVMSLKPGAQEQSLHPSALSPARPMPRPLPDQRGGLYVTFYCMAFILLGSWGRDVGWLFPALPAHSSSCPAPQAFYVCAWPLAALAVALAYAKYSFWKDFFL